MFYLLSKYISNVHNNGSRFALFDVKMVQCVVVQVVVTSIHYIWSFNPLLWISYSPIYPIHAFQKLGCLVTEQNTKKNGFFFNIHTCILQRNFLTSSPAALLRSIYTLGATCTPFSKHWITPFKLWCSNVNPVWIFL